MRTKAEVQKMVRGLLSAELRSRLQLATNRLPHLCTHNHRQPLDNRKTVDGATNVLYNRITSKSLPVEQTMGLCMLGSENIESWPGTICEDPIDAQKCPYYNPKVGKDKIIAEFKDQLQDGAWIEKNMPVVSSLLWVLGATTTHLPWWQMLYFRLRRWSPTVEPPTARLLYPDDS